MRCKAGLFSRFVPFSPAVIAGLTGWWDASDSATLFDSTTGGSLVAADSGVARWQDKSGNEKHFVQSNSSVQPTRKTSQRNSLDVLRFNGSDFMNSGLSWPWGDIVADSAYTIFAVASAATISGDNSEGSLPANASILADSGAYNYVFNFRSSGLVGGAVFETSSYISVFETYTAGEWKTFTQRFSVSDGQISVRVNGGSPETASISSNHAGGEFFPILSASSVGNRLNGDIAELITYNVALSASDREAVESYLMDKWAIT